jgi:ParB-like chromosome segregation protein Spo0J
VIRYHEAQIEHLVPIDSVHPDPYNANNGDVDELMASILTNGCYRPVFASRATGTIVAGHTLYASLLELGAQEIPVQWVDGDREQEVRINLADNEIARLARMDNALLVQQLDQIAATEKGLAGTGFTEDRHDELRMLALDAGGFHVPEPQPDPYPHRCPECHHEWFGACAPDTEV